MTNDIQPRCKSWIAEKRKIRAVRYFLSITDPNFQDVRNAFVNLRYFRTKRAQEVFDNPFLNGNSRIYVLSRIASWADVVYKFQWWLYACEDGLPEIKNALARKPFRTIGEGDYSPLEYDIALNNNRVAFFNARK